MGSIASVRDEARQVVRLGEIEGSIDQGLHTAEILSAALGHRPFGLDARDFAIRDVELPGVTLHRRIGGQGDAVVLLHGFGETGDMGIPLATELRRSLTLVVPDLRGMGLSSHPAGGRERGERSARRPGFCGSHRPATQELGHATRIIKVQPARWRWND